MRYANPTVAKTLCNWSASALSSDSEVSGERSGARSIIGKEVKFVVMMDVDCKTDNVDSYQRQ